MQKLYCYVDETGQDTHGTLFSVCCTITVSLELKDQLEHLVEKIEQESRKKSKWQKTDKKVKHAFLDALVANHGALKGHIFIEHFYNIKDFVGATTEAIARSIYASHYQQSPALIYIDGLPKRLIQQVATMLRRHGVFTEKVKGLRDEQSVLIRLSDAIAGFTRDYLEGEDYTKPYFLQLLSAGVIVEI